VAKIIADAGGEVVGRTKLQKTAFLLSLAGLDDAFRFGYKYYGPFSEGLAAAAELAAAFDVIAEDRQPTSWGGTYSVYRSPAKPSGEGGDRSALARAAAAADAVILELAATAAYLEQEGRPDPWGETVRRKPDKAGDGRLGKAKTLYRQLRIASGNRLPEISAA
jgi:hypothetical protein